MMRTRTAAILVWAALAPAAAGAAELRVTGISATPKAVKPGARISIVDSVRVRGKLSTGFYVSWYASTDDTITTSDVLLGRRWIAPRAGDLFTSNATTEVTLPAGLSGKLRVGAIADAENAVSGGGDGRKVKAGSTLAVGQPDISMMSLQVHPPKPDAGDTLTITDEVTASGGDVGGFWVRYYASADATVTTADVALGARWIAGLASGARSRANTDVTLPVGLAGDLWIGAIADADGGVEESNEANNVLSDTVTVSLPDLRVSNVRVTPNDPAAGGQLTLEDTVRTTGATGGFWVRYYASTDNTITTSDTPLGGRWVESLPAKGNSEGSTVVTLPASLYGSFFVGAIADADGGVVESNEDNNTARGPRITVNLPDLVVRSVTAAPTTLGAGQKLTITTQVAASGAAAGGFWVRYYASTDSTITTGDVSLGGRWVAGLAAGATDQASAEVALPGGLFGSFYVGAIVDSDGGIPESNESNNALAGNTVTVVRPDLVPVALTAEPLSVPAGGAFTVTDSVRATGAAAGAFAIRFYASPDATITTDDVPLGGRSVSGLAAGETSTASTALSLPLGVSGSFYLGAIVDPEGNVPETDRTNNALTGPVMSVALPDLTVSTLMGAPAALAPGGHLTVTDVVAAANAAAGSFEVRYVLSGDAVVSPDDLELGRRTVSGLGAGETSAGSTLVTIPAVAPGTYYLGAVVDDADQVGESNETNNTALGTVITITRPDLIASPVTATPIAVYPGSQLSVRYGATASGGSTGVFQVRVYASYDVVITSEDVLLFSVTMPALAAGQRFDRTTTVLVPASLDHHFYVGAIVDAENAVEESDETNNVAVCTTGVTLLHPDLQPTALTFAPAAVAAGGQLAISDTVAVTIAPAGRFRVDYFLSSDPVITSGDALLGSRTIDGLAIGASSSATTTVTLPGSAAGTWYVGALVDAGAEVTEMYEENNAISGGTVEIARSDLVAGPVSATPTTLQPGGTLQVTSSVTAQGSVPSSFQVGIYLSADAALSADDLFLGSRSVASLASGQTSTETTSLGIPGTLSGSYRVLAVVDSVGEVAESDESNNVAAGDTISISKPDLAVGTVTVSPAAVGAGGAITIADSVTATGGAISAFAVHYYASRDGTITAQDVFLGSRTVSGLASGQTSTGSTTVALPVELTGTWYLGAVVDGGGVVDEADESNNVAVSAPFDVARPDLVPGPVALSPSTVEAGGAFTVTESVTARNGGAGPFQIRCYLSPDPVITPADTLLGSRTVSGLAAGGASSGTATYTLPASATGTWYVGTVVDGDEAVAESDETNNTSSGAPLTVSRPNLTVASVSASPASLGAGGALDVTETVAAAGSSVGSFKVGLYLSLDGTVTRGDVRIGERTVPALAAGATSTATTHVQLAAGLAGTWTVGAIADVDDAVNETNEDDNAAAGNAVVIARPDLVAASLAVAPATLGAGGSVTVTDTVTASGGAAGASMIRYYLSPDPVISAEDVALGSRAVPALAAGESSQGATVLALPVARTGNWYVGAVIDADGAVDESNESNNLPAAVSISILRPDLRVASLQASPPVVGVGEPLQIWDTVTSADGGAGPFSIAYALVREDGTGTPVALGSRAVAGLAAGGSNSEVAALAIPVGPSGRYRVTARVDPGDAIPESDETNNSITGPVVQVGVDTTPPAIAITGVTDGLVTREQPVTVCVAVDDPNLASYQATLDGLQFQVCTTTYLEQDHEVIVHARDTFDNESSSTVNFAIDLTKPKLTLGGVADGVVLNAEQAIPTFTVEELHPRQTVALLNGQPFQSGTPVTAEADYTLTVAATDAAGNEESGQLAFAIDRTKPVIQFSGVTEGAVLPGAVTPGVHVSDAHPGALTVTLDGQPYQPGTAIEASGNHVLAATAVDLATPPNTGDGQVHFSINRTGPTVTIVAPANGTITSASSVEVRATATDEDGVTSLTVNGVTVSPGPDGAYVTTVALGEGPNTIQVVARDPANNPGTASVTVRRDSTAPSITLVSPAEGASFFGPVTVTGFVTDAGTPTLTVNGQAVALGPDGGFSTTVTLGEGPQTVTVVATDEAGNHDQQVRNVTVSSGPPTLVVSEPPQGFVATSAQLTVRGTVHASSGALTVTVNGESATVGADGAFSTVLTLSTASVTVHVVATDAQGRTAEQTIQGTYDTGSGEPGTPGTLALTVDEPTDRAVLGNGAVTVTGRVEGGKEPYTVTVAGTRASVTAGYFGAGLNLVEGDHTLVIRASDAENHVVTVERSISVDHTAPYLAVTRPGSAAAQVSESPYVVEGDVSDVHLASVTVAGRQASVLAGKFSCAVPLQVGDNAVAVVARDAAANETTRSLLLHVAAIPPTVTILEPVDGGEAPSAVIKVRARVDATSAIQQVSIGTGAAAQEGGVWTADYGLALGDNVVTVVATDANGLSGSASVRVHYRDVTQEPLAVTGVDPLAGATGIEPDVLVSVSFNKPVQRNSLTGHFTVSAGGQPLAGGFYVAPGEQTASFVARSSLPEGERISVQVDGVEPQAGPGMSGSFSTEFLVRARRPQVVGHLLDEHLQPLPEVQVSLEGTTFSTRTGPDGSWHLVGVPAGSVMVTYTGGMLEDGSALPTLHRRLFVSGTDDTIDPNLIMVATDRASVEYLDARNPLHAIFAGRQGALAIDAAEGAFFFEDGKTSGFASATRVPAFAVPVPIENGRDRIGALWQLSPGGIRFTRPLTLTFPNLNTLPPGRFALVLVYDPNRRMLERGGLARVSDDGSRLTTVEPVQAEALDFFGYALVNDAQQEYLVAKLDPAAPTQPETPAPDGSSGFLFDRRPGSPPRWAQLLMLPLGAHRAEALLPYMMSFGSMPEPNVGTAFIRGKIRSPQERVFNVTVAGELGEKANVPIPYPAQKFTFTAKADETQGIGSYPITISMRAARGQTVIGAPSDETWTGLQGDGTATVSGTVQLEPGTTLITAEAQSLRESRTARVEAVLTENPVDPITGKRTGKLTVRQLVETEDSAASQGISFFANWPVEVTSASTVKGASGPGGAFQIPVFSYGDEQGALVCTEVQTGLRWIVQADWSDAEHPKLVRYMVTDGFPVCQNVFSVSPGSSSPVSLTVDMRLLAGTVNFYNRDDRPVGGACDPNAKSEWDSTTNELKTISMADVEKTEIYFFREDDLETPIGRYAMVTPPSVNQSSGTCSLAAHGEYKKLRFGPSERWTKRDREFCDQEKAKQAVGSQPSDEYKLRCEGTERILGLRLSEGDHLVVVGVNHATGYTGATTVVVPPITTKSGLDAQGRCAADDAQGPISFYDYGQQVTISRCAQQDIRIQGNLRMYPPEIDVRIARQVAPEGASTDPEVHLVRHGGSATVRDDLVYVSTHWRVRLPPEDLDGDGTPNLTDRCDTEPGPPSSFGCPDPNNPGWTPPPPVEPTPTAPSPLTDTGIPSTGGQAWPYPVAGAAPGPAVDPFDLDQDGVADSSDLCPYLPARTDEGGFRGCPAGTDSDHDGTPNESEGSAECIFAPGPVTTHGCPDPTQPFWTPPPDQGSAQDTDGDGIPDSTDLCPAVPGPQAEAGKGLNGCPSLASRFDTDEDGIPDDVDECIWQKGDAAHYGCEPPPDPITGEPWTPPQTESAPAIAGGPGKMLEKFCSELISPTAEQLKICTKMEARLMDVPKGVPPLAGQLVRVTGSAVEKPAVAVFPVAPGRYTADVQTALRLRVTDPSGNSGTVTTNLDKANYYVHVVGNLTLFNDKNGDGRIDPASEVAVSPPAFQEPTEPPQGWKAGMPEFAVPLKNVYRSFEPDGSVVERFDRDREQEFRVLDLSKTTVTANPGTGSDDPNRRRVDQSDGSVAAHTAQEGDASYEMLLHLIAPDDPGRAGTLPGTYQVRLGSDDYGIDCQVQQDATTLTATCDGAWIYDVLSSRDLVYIAVTMSGNAENILYKYNLAGLSARTDLVTAGHQTTASKSILADQGGEPQLLRPISEPALANFFVSPNAFRNATVTLKADGSEIQKFDIGWQEAGGNFEVTPAAQGDTRPVEQVPRVGVDASTLFRLAIPQQYGKMPGLTAAGAEIEVELQDKDDPDAAPKTIGLGKPQGAFQGANARAPGQAGTGGVNVADGHLSFRHEDFTLPELAGGVRFARTYDNADNEIGTLGIGWRHNFESYVVEERPGRYSVVIEGQSYDFPDCEAAPANDTSQAGWECKSDNSHGGKLIVRERKEADPNAPRHTPDVLFETASGYRYRFDRYSQKALQIASSVNAYVTAHSVQEQAEYQVKVGNPTPIQTELPRKMIRDAGRRRWVLTAMEDGHGKPVDAAHPLDPGKNWTVLQYFADSDMIRRVYRKGGKLELDFAYETVDLQNRFLSPRFKAAAVAWNFGFLTRVEAKKQKLDAAGAPVDDNPGYVVRLDFKRIDDKGRNRGNLIAVERHAGEGTADDRPVDQAWRYTYVDDPQALAPTGRTLKGIDLWEATNELEKAVLVVDGREQWKSVWNRSLAASAYPHVKAFEVVDRMQLPGTSTVAGTRAGSGDMVWPEATPAWTTVQWTGQKTRRLTRADGVVIDADLNDYGNVTVESLAGATLSTNWFSDQEGAKVQPSARTAPGGRAISFESTDDNRLRPKATTFSAAGSSDSHPVAGLSAGQKMVDRTYGSAGPDDPVARFGVPSQTTRATRAGSAVASTPINQNGDPTEIKLTETGASSDLLNVNLGGNAYDNEGVLQEVASDPVGRNVRHTDRDDTWGLYRTTTTKLDSAQGGGGLASLETRREYDWLGRLRSELDVEVGRSTSWTYDSVGRLRSRTVAGTPEQTFGWAFQSPADGQLAITETLAATAHQRVKYYVDGLLVRETWKYGNNETAERVYRYVGGRMEGSTDERGVERVYHYDSRGRLEYVTATAPGATAKEEIRYQRDDEGKVKQETDQNGLVTKIEYDQLGRAVSWERGLSGPAGPADTETLVLDPGGAATERKHGSYTWETRTDALGRVTATLAKDDQNQLNTTTEYDALGRRTHQTDHVLGLEEWWEYQDVLGRQTLYRRSVAPYTTELRETRTYTDSGDIHAVDVTQTVGANVTHSRERLDAAGRTVEVVQYVPRSGGGTVESHRYFQYDPRGLVVAERSPIGDGPAEPAAPATTATTAVATHVYDAVGNVRASTDPAGYTTTYGYFGDGSVKTQDGPHPGAHWSYEYDAFGQVTRKELIGSGAGWTGGVWSYQYGPSATFNGTQGACSGPPTAVETDPLGYQTARWYNAAQRLLCEAKTDRSSDPDRGSGNQQQVEISYDGPWVKKQVVREGNATTTLERTSYDHRGRVLHEIETFANSSAAETGYQYTVDTPWSGRAVSIDERWVAGAQSGSRPSRRETDALGNAISHTWGTGGTIVDAWTYDASGRLLSEQPAGRPVRTVTYVEGLPTASTLGVGDEAEPTTYDYWASGKQQAETGPDLRSRRLVWDARGLLRTEEYGRTGDVDTRQYTYDEAGNPRTSAHGVGQQPWTYQYGPRGELVQVAPPPGGGSAWQYQYDARATLVGITPPVEGGSAAQTFQYDYLGRQLRRTRGPSAWTTEWADGASTTLEPADGQHPGQRSLYRALDGRGRTALERYSGVPTDLTQVATTYDVLDQPLLVRETRGTGDVEVTFDYADPRRLLTDIRRNGSDHVQYGRLASGEVSYVTSPSGSVSYGYDGLARLRTVESGPYTTTLTWEAGGARLLDADDATRLHECRRYDARGRLALVGNVESGESCESSLTPLAQFRYHYDERGNRLWEDYQDGTLSTLERTEYGYDPADRLTGVLYPGGVAQLYRLGADGSRMGLKDVPAYSSSLGPDGFAAANAPEQVYQYDTRGGLTAITDGAGGTIATYEVDTAGRVRVETRLGDRSEYTWDAGGRLTAATVLKGGTTRSFSYQYDFAGRRIRKSGPTGETRYVWGDDELLEETTSTGRLLYERGAGYAFGVTSFDSGGQVVARERLLHDGLDSVVGRVAGSGSAVIYRYDAWGGFRGGAQPAGSDPTLAYAGQHWDADLGLSYAQQRWYEPASGRFLSEDPVFGDPGRPNSLMAFGYANANPLGFMDPHGTSGYDDLSPMDLQQYDVAEACHMRAGKANAPAYCANAQTIAAEQAAWDKAQTGITVGQGRAITDMVVSAATVTPQKMALQGLLACLREVDPHRGFLANWYWCTSAAVNTLNPAYQAMVSTYETGRAIERGDAVGVGYHSTNAGIATVQTVTTAVGGAKLVTSVGLAPTGRPVPPSEPVLETTLAPPEPAPPAAAAGPELAPPAAAAGPEPAPPVAATAPEPSGGSGKPPVATAPYKRPSGATTTAQRQSVQGKACVKCGAPGGKRIAGHKKALVEEHYETGTIDRARMRSVEAVQPECTTCSAKEGAAMSRYSREQKALLESAEDAKE